MTEPRSRKLRHQDPGHNTCICLHSGLQSTGLWNAQEQPVCQHPARLKSSILAHVDGHIRTEKMPGIKMMHTGTGKLTGESGITFRDSLVPVRQW